LNSLLESVLEGAENVTGKKFVAHGKEALTFTDIDNLIRQVYCPPGTSHQQSVNLLRKVIESYHLFANGNNHIINYSKMLGFLQGKDSQNEGYSDLADALYVTPKSFREYYSYKLDVFSKDSNTKIEEDEKENLTYPHYSLYWQNSLN
jgi:hypothetical protein